MNDTDLPQAPGEPQDGNSAPQAAVVPQAPQIDAAAIAEAVTRGLVAAGFGGRREEVAPPVRRRTIEETYAGWTDDQKAKFDLEVSASPGKAAIAIAKAMAAEQMQDFAQGASPYMETSGQLFIENFITQKSGQDRMFAKVEPEFRKELNDVDVTALLQLPAAQRNRQLSLRWDAAANKVFRTAAASVAPPNGANIGASGGRGAGGGKVPRKAGVMFDDEQLANEPAINVLAANLKAQGLLSDEDLDEIQKTYKGEYLGEL